MSTTTISEQQPWLLTNFEYGSGVLALHREIDHFYNYITSTPTEYMMRMEAVYRIENVVLHTWPEACIEVFGSFSTALNLPISDIDIVVDNIYWHSELLVQLKNALIARGLPSMSMFWTRHLCQSSSLQIGYRRSNLIYHLI